MKKNNISVDIIAFGDLNDNTIKTLQAFNENVKGGDGSHLEIVRPGPNLLSDSIIATPILAGEGMGGAGGVGGAAGEGGDGGATQFEFGVNPELDPELALALRMSYEEEKARQEKERKAKEEAEKKEKLEDIPEADEKQPLLDQNGEASGSGAAEVSKSTEEADKKDKAEDEDKMDMS
jgi:26S proteasome regulatory subunit N10